MEIKFKKLDEKAVMPVRAHKGDAGLDLTCIGVQTGVNDTREILLICHTGLAVEIPEGYVGLLFPRSSICKKSVELTNSVGVIDSSYRGEITAVFRVTVNGIPEFYKEGEKFAQLVIVPIPELEVVEAEELSETERGANGFGSTDNESSAPIGGEESVENKESADVVTDSEKPEAEVAAGDENAPEQA